MCYTSYWQYISKSTEEFLAPNARISKSQKRKIAEIWGEDNSVKDWYSGHYIFRMPSLNVVHCPEQQKFDLGWWDWIVGRYVPGFWLETSMKYLMYYWLGFFSPFINADNKKRNINIEVPYNLTIPFLDIYPKWLKSRSLTDIWRSMSSAKFTIVKMEITPMFISQLMCNQNVAYIYNKINSILKSNEILIYAFTWMNP